MYPKQGIDQHGNIIQQMPNGEWFLVQSADGEPAELGEIIWQETPGISAGAKAWLLISCILLLGAIGFMMWMRT